MGGKSMYICPNKRSVWYQGCQNSLDSFLSVLQVLIAFKKKLLINPSL